NVAGAWACDRAARSAWLQLEQVSVCAGRHAQGKIDISLLNQMSAMAAAQGYSLTDKVWQLCNGWLMEAKRANGSPAILFVDPKTQTLIDVDFSKSREETTWRKLDTSLSH